MAVEHQQVLTVLVIEAQPFVEAAAVGGHQVDPLAGGHRWAAEQGLHDASAEAEALVFLRDHHIPEHRSEHPVAGGAADSHQVVAPPGTHHAATAQQHAQQGPAVAPLGPKAVGVKESSHLVDPEQQLQGQPAVADQCDRCLGAYCATA